MRLYVYQPERNDFTLTVGERNAQMPYVEHLRFSVGDFAGCENTDLCWTDSRALQALDELYRETGIPFRVDGAFRRPGGSGGLMRGLGQTFYIGAALPPEQRHTLGRRALERGLFAAVSPPWAGGYSLRLTATPLLPRLLPGERGANVFALQDLLLRQGFFRGALTGRFCALTRRGVLALQRAAGIAETGAVDPGTWQALTRIDKRLAEWENRNESIEETGMDRTWITESCKTEAIFAGWPWTAWRASR